ncbi:sulfide/dihydroorotate dehydrogenase-like FAD/NAD-binding protein [Christensenellaceae bacterium OttesenSCG-928-K19]|nr:sulfide/dihydroorotate dehydrogenase-like FAD/NAD-binding protein [Christensenellaceae bacterium OttesenSCG-928-K19]
MFKILEKRELAENIVKMVIDAPLIAKKAQSGQFVVLRTHDKGERFPLTIADYDRDKGTVTIIFAQVGKSTEHLGTLNEGDGILDVVGPLGVASHFDPAIKKVAVIGGGLGCAIALPQAKTLHGMGVSVDMIAGFRTKDLVILEEEMKAASANLYIATDDGSYGIHGFVTKVLQDRMDEGVNYDLVVAIGPIPMMKFVSELTRPKGIKTLVSMNPVMIDGTGMCGGCRLTVGGKTKFACIDGPDFDGHEVDFDGAMRRLSMYDGMKERSEDCNLVKQAEGKK